MSRRFLALLLPLIGPGPDRSRTSRSKKQSAACRTLRRRRPAFESLEQRRVLSVAADAFEPNDTPAEATAININSSPQFHSIHDGGQDIDWLRFSLNADADVLVQLGGPDIWELDLELYDAWNPREPIAYADPYTGVLRSHAAPPGSYLLRVAGRGFEVESYSIHVQADTPVPVLQRVDYVKLAGEGFNSIQFTPDGRLAQLLWYGEDLTYRVTSPPNQVTEETILTLPSAFGLYDTRDTAQAQLLFAADATPHILMAHDYDALVHYRRDVDGWLLVEQLPLDLDEFEWISHLAAATGPDSSLHFVATVGDWESGRLLYGSNQTGDWQVQQAASPAATDYGAYVAADRPRFVSLAVDANNRAHVVYTPEFIDNGQGGFSRPFSQLAYATNQSGQWQTQIVHQPGDDSGDSGSGASIAIGPNGQPAIGHFFVDRVSTGSASFSRLLYHQRQANGSWTTETVASSPDGYIAGDGAKFTGFAPHLVFDRQGLPHIAFSDYASQHFPQWGADEFAGQIRHAIKEDGQWSIQRILPQSDPLRNQMIYPSMAVWSDQIVFVGIRRFDFLGPDSEILRSDHYYVSAVTPRVGLTLTPTDLTIVEGSQTSLLVTRNNGNNASPLTVTLTNGDPTELDFTTTVTIPSGQHSVSILVDALNDNITDGTQTVTITAAAAGYVAGHTIINVADIPYGELHGFKFADLDGDGIRSANEPGLSGWTIFLDENNNGQLDSNERSTIAGSDGSYAFTDVPPGSYQVVAVPQSGWGTTTPLTPSHSVTLTAGQSLGGIDFGSLSAGFDEATGRLSVLASAGEDVYIGAEAGLVVVLRQGVPDTQTSNIAANSVRLLVVLGAHGDNQVDLTGVTVADFPQLDSVIIRAPNAGSDEIVGSEFDDQIYVAGSDRVYLPGGNNRIFVRDLDFIEIVGGAGFDTLLLDGSGMHLDSTTLAPDRLVGVDRIDLTGDGPNQLTLSAAAVVGLTTDSDTLQVRAGHDDQVHFEPGWTLASSIFVEGQHYHRIIQDGVTVLLDNPRPWQNPIDRMDVNGDGEVSPIDVLLVINVLNAMQAGPLPDPSATGQAPPNRLDVSGDGVLSPVDALLVINHLNQRSFGGGESLSESSGRLPDTSNHVPANYDAAFAWALDEWLREEDLKRRRR